MDESKIQNELMKNFKKWEIPEKLENKLPNHPKIKIEKKAKIPYQIWLEPSLDSTPSSLQVRHYEQDIVLYSESKITNSESLSFYNIQNETNLRIPYFVVEVKRGVSTHDLITCSKKAEKIKNIFPFLQYFFVAGANITRKWKIHATFLDEMYGLGSEEDLEEWNLEKLKGKTLGSLNTIQEDIELLSTRG